MMSGYEQIYEGLLPRLAECDLAESAGRLGLELEPDGAVRVTFLNRDYVITREGVEPADGKPMHVNTGSVLLYYILSKGSGEPKNSFVPLAHLATKLQGQNALGQGIMVKPLVREFGSAPDKLKAAVEKVGGTYKSGPSATCHTFLLSPLPKLPVKIVFYEADDEFPAEIQILFDETAARFLEFECLAFLCGCLVHALVKAGQ